MRHRTAAVLLLVACAACTPTDPSGSSPTMAVAPPTDGAADDVDDTRRDDPRDCDTETLADLDEVVGGQLDAFADDDWDDALALASAGFREEFDATRFAAVVEGSFPVAADAVDHRLGGCVTTTTEAQVLVEVESGTGDEATLVYALVREAGAWRIAGAVPTGDEPEDEGPLV